jgi:prefoldin alpha subunit
MQLPPADLAKLRQSLTEDVQTITQNYGNLKLAHSKYGQALEALQDITPENKDKRIMVPLTSSMYIPGTLANIESVLVDVGTGYFVEKVTQHANKLRPRNKHGVVTCDRLYSAIPAVKRTACVFA